MDSSNRGMRSRKRQTTLSFAPIASSSPVGERSPAHMRFRDPLGSSSPRPKRLTFTGETSISTSQLSPSTSSDEDPILISSSKLKATKRRSSSSSESEDIITSSPAKRRRKNAQVVIPQRLTEAESFDANEISDESDIVRSSPTRRRRVDLQAHTPQRNGKAGLRGSVSSGKMKKGSKKRDKEPQADLEDLEDSDVIRPRTRGTPAMSTAKARRQQQLELLKRRRAGDKTLEPVGASVKDEDGDENSQVSDISHDESNDSEDSEGSPSPEDPQADNDSDIEPPLPEDLDEYEDDFVVNDEELGVPADEIDIPFEFTRHRYKRLKDHFKDVVEWMVHNKLNPAFQRGDAVYEMAFQKVEDEVKGLAGSQFVSSVWNSDFLSSLKARPRMVELPYPTSEGRSCDACNRKNHPASFDVRFDGSPYVPDTLEPVCPDDELDEDESMEEDWGNIDNKGNVIPNEDKHFYLGRHCKSRSSMAHTLFHWRYHLNEWVLGYLEKTGILEDDEILKRERWSQKKRTKYTDGVVEAMKEAGEVDRLWRDFNLNLKTARASITSSRW